MTNRDTTGISEDTILYIREEVEKSQRQGGYKDAQTEFLLSD